MDARQYFLRLQEAVNKEKPDDYEFLELFAFPTPLHTSDSRALNFLRNFFISETLKEAYEEVYGDKEGFLKALREMFEALPALSDDKDQRLDPWLLYSAMNQKQDVIKDPLSRDMSEFMVNYFPNETSVSESFRLGIVVTTIELPKDLQNYISEIAWAYAFGSPNAACALARTSLERAMVHICDEKEKLWDRVHKIAIKSGIKKKIRREDIYTNYPPFCVRMAVTHKDKVLDKEIDKLYHRFSRLIHGREPVGSESLELIKRSFRAIEKLYDLHYPLNK